jgi:hypothetical protein
MGPPPLVPIQICAWMDPPPALMVTVAPFVYVGQEPETFGRLGGIMPLGDEPLDEPEPLLPPELEVDASSDGSDAPELPPGVVPDDDPEPPDVDPRDEPEDDPELELDSVPEPPSALPCSELPLLVPFRFPSCPVPAVPGPSPAAQADARPSPAKPTTAQARIAPAT